MDIQKSIQDKIKEQENLIKSSYLTPIEDEIRKSRAGIYENTPENQKLGRVGQKYGAEKKGNDRETMTNLEWGNTTEERNKNLDKYDSLKTDEEKQKFLKEIKAKHYKETEKKEKDLPKKVIIEINNNDEKSIKKAEKQKSDLENKGYNLDYSTANKMVYTLK